MGKRNAGLAEVSLAPYVGHLRAQGEPDDAGERRGAPRYREPVPPRRGWARAWGGRTAVIAPVPVFRGSTAQVQGLYPWLLGGSLPPAGAPVGIDCLTGGSFSCHPLAWLAAGAVSNPNIVITGMPGVGKSATIKALALRLSAYGVRSFIAGDLKNEYALLARALGTEPIELGPGLAARLNPLDAGPLGRHLPADAGQLAGRLAEIHRRRLMLVCSLAAMRLGRPLTPTEESAVSLAICEASGFHEASGQVAAWPGGGGGGLSLWGADRATPANPTIGQVWAVLRDPTAQMARELRVRDESVAELREMTRAVTDALGGMVRGALAGLFDGPTTVAPDFGAPVQAVDLSRMAGRGDETVAMILACVSSWAQAAIDEPGPARMIVRDELWRSLSIPALVRKVDSDLRLSRAQGTIQVLATHRLADFEAAGPRGSAEAAIAANLVASCDTRVCMRQDTMPLEDLARQIALTDVECEHIASWSAHHVGRAIWKVGRSASAVVQTILTPAERRLFETNERMGMASRDPVTSDGLTPGNPEAGGRHG